MSALREQDQELADQLRQVTRQADSIESVLTTNDRVIARVTDGIYRQPGSAIRELIANAYDADATWVSVKTDAPKFSRITIEDNGTGMTPDAVIHLLHNIGGSAKRTEQGQELRHCIRRRRDHEPGRPPAHRQARHRHLLGVPAHP